MIDWNKQIASDQKTCGWIEKIDGRSHDGVLWFRIDRLVLPDINRKCLEDLKYEYGSELPIPEILPAFILTSFIIPPWIMSAKTFEIAKPIKIEHISITGKERISFNLFHEVKKSETLAKNYALVEFNKFMKSYLNT